MNEAKRHPLPIPQTRRHHEHPGLALVMQSRELDHIPCCNAVNISKFLIVRDAEKLLTCLSTRPKGMLTRYRVC